MSILDDSIFLNYHKYLHEIQIQCSQNHKKRKLLYLQGTLHQLEVYHSILVHLADLEKHKLDLFNKKKNHILELSQGLEGVQILLSTLVGALGAFPVHLGHLGIASSLVPSNGLVMVILYQ